MGKIATNWNFNHVNLRQSGSFIAILSANRSLTLNYTTEKIQFANLSY